MKIISLLTIFLCVGAFAQKPAAKEGMTLTEASLSIAKRVCADHPEANVWIYVQTSWNSLPCLGLPPVFDLDKDNAFDALIPMIEKLHKSEKAK